MLTGNPNPVGIWSPSFGFPSLQGMDCQAKKLSQAGLHSRSIQESRTKDSRPFWSIPKNLTQREPPSSQTLGPKVFQQRIVSSSPRSTKNRSKKGRYSPATHAFDRRGPWLSEGKGFKTRPHRFLHLLRNAKSFLFGKV